MERLDDGNYSRDREVLGLDQDGEPMSEGRQNSDGLSVAEEVKAVYRRFYRLKWLNNESDMVYQGEFFSNEEGPEIPK